MALTFLTITVTCPKDETKSFKRRLLVDTGVLFSIIPKSHLKKINVTPDSKQKFKLPNEGVTEKEIGEAKFSWRGITRTTPVIFGEPGVYVIGTNTLEAMGIAVDPINRKIQKLPVLL